MATSKLRTLLAGVLVLCIATAAVSFVEMLGAERPPASQGNTGTRQVRDYGLQSIAEGLYAQASGMGGEKNSTRRKAARQLARHEEGEPWLVLLFLSSQTAPTGDKDEQYRQRGMHSFELSVVFAAIEALPEDVSPEVLWALTFMFGDKESARWGDDDAVIVMSEYISKPIREEARACLTKRIGVDYGWDASRWRRAILSEGQSKGYRASHLSQWMSYACKIAIALVLVLLGWVAALVRYRKPRRPGAVVYEPSAHSDIRISGDTVSAGISRHGVEDERALRGKGDVGQAPLSEGKK